MSSKQLTGAALTAKIIKTRLNARYPSVKFSVTSDVFSMGDSVDIRWTNGPLKETVEAITQQYRQGSFDGMQDIYEYRNIDPSLGCKGAKYVHCNRQMSDEYRAMLAAKADEYYGKADTNDPGYYHRLAEIEKMFFPYPEAEHRPGAVSGQRNTAHSGLEMDIIKDIDTRDNSEIYVVKVKTRVDDFTALRREMGSFGGYYSRYKRGFIFKEDPTEMLYRGSGDEGDFRPKEESA